MSVCVYVCFLEEWMMCLARGNEHTNTTCTCAVVLLCVHDYMHLQYFMSERALSDSVAEKLHTIKYMHAYMHTCIATVFQ